MEKQKIKHEISLKEICQRLDEIELRISALEQRNQQHYVPKVSHKENETEDIPLFPKFLPGVSRVRIFSVIGRTFMILAGAFLLRALTENQTFIPKVGAIIGLIYSLVWLFFTIKSSKKQDSFSATFYGISSVIIAYPLIFEATTKLDVFSPLQAVGILFLFSIVAMFISFTRKLRAVYIFFVLAAIASSVPLMIKTGKVELYTTFILIIGLSTLVFKYYKNWDILPWVAAFFVNISIVFLSSLASNPDRLTGKYSNISGTFSLALIIFFIITYLSGFIAATLILKKRISIFGMFQSLLALIIGLAGAITITHKTGLAYYSIGVFTSVFAVSFFLIAFKYIKPEAKVNFYYYSWMAFILATVSIGMLSSINLKVIFFGVLSIFSISLTKYIDRFNTLSVQSVLYLLLSAWFSNLIKKPFLLLLSSSYTTFDITPVFVFSLILAILVYVLHLFFVNQDEFKFYLPRFVILLVTVIGIFGFTILILCKPFAFNGNVINLQKLALIRTLVLSISAILLAWFSNKPKFYELAFLVYPILIITGLKLIFEDLNEGSPMTLFIGFVIYGIALISAPKIRRKKPEINT